MFEMPEPINDTNWYPASNHVIIDATNLMTKANYFGIDCVHVGKGMGLTIKQIDQSSFPSLFPKILSLKHLLNVLEITKNLLSVSKFAHFFLYFVSLVMIHDHAKAIFIF